ncbi:MAG: VWA domain-containing protein, partial [Defluviitaleaceae bacterium]|nr:VWA domain-containing protein [Defluviitaleaceae bacterium]
MIKDKTVNVPLLLIGLFGCGLAFLLGELLLRFISQLSFIFQAGLFMVFAALMCGMVIMVSETLASGGYVQHWRGRFSKDSLRAWLIFIPIAFIIGFGTQFLYNFAGRGKEVSIEDFQGTFLVCDISGSMNSNDPNYEALKALVSYLGDVEIGEHLGVILYESNVHLIYPYKPLASEAERSELVNYIETERMSYYGGTNTQDAL